MNNRHLFFMVLQAQVQDQGLTDLVSGEGGFLGHRWRLLHCPHMTERANKLLWASLKGRIQFMRLRPPDLTTS